MSRPRVESPIRAGLRLPPDPMPMPTGSVYVRDVLLAQPELSRFHRAREQFEELRELFERFAQYRNPYYWRNWFKLHDAEVLQDALSQIPEDQVSTRLKTWNRLPERMRALRMQEVLAKMVQELATLQMGLNGAYQLLMAEHGAAITLCDVLGDYQHMRGREVRRRRLCRRLFVGDYFDSRNEKQMFHVFTEWWRTTRYERDVVTLKDYIEKSKETIARAVEANAMMDYLLEFKRKLEEEVQPALDAKILECRVLQRENDEMKALTEKLTKELKDTKAELQRTKQALTRSLKRTRKFMSRVSFFGQDRNRWREEALIRFAMCGFLLEKLRDVKLKYQILGEANEDLVAQTEKQAKRIKDLKNEIANLEIALEKQKQKTAYNIERKKHWAERARMANDELKQQTAVRMAHEHNIRNVLEPELKRLGAKVSELGNEMARKEAEFKRERKRLVEMYEDMKHKYLVEKNEKELALQRVAMLEDRVSDLSKRLKKAEKLNKELETRNKFLERENKAMEILTKGMGPPVPAGFLCDVCQKDVLSQKGRATHVEALEDSAAIAVEATGSGIDGNGKLTREDLAFSLMTRANLEADLARRRPAWLLRDAAEIVLSAREGSGLAQAQSPKSGREHVNTNNVNSSSSRPGAGSTRNSPTRRHKAASSGMKNALNLFGMDLFGDDPYGGSVPKKPIFHTPPRPDIFRDNSPPSQSRSGMKSAKSLLRPLSSSSKKQTPKTLARSPEKDAVLLRQKQFRTVGHVAPEDMVRIMMVPSRWAVGKSSLEEADKGNENDHLIDERGNDARGNDARSKEGSSSPSGGGRSTRHRQAQRETRLEMTEAEEEERHFKWTDDKLFCVVHEDRESEEEQGEGGEAEADGEETRVAEADGEETRVAEADGEETRGAEADGEETRGAEADGEETRGAEADGEETRVADGEAPEAQFEAPAGKAGKVGSPSPGGEDEAEGEDMARKGEGRESDEEGDGEAERASNEGKDVCEDAPPSPMKENNEGKDLDGELNGNADQNGRVNEMRNGGNKE